ALWRFQPEMTPGGGGGDTPPSRPGDEAGAHQVGLTDLLDGAGFLADRDGQGVHADRAAAVPADERVEHGTVEAVGAELIDVEDLQGALGGGEVDVSVGVDLREVTDATQQTVGDARGAARAGGDLHGGVGVHGHVEDTGRA